MSTKTSLRPLFLAAILLIATVTAASTITINSTTGAWTGTTGGTSVTITTNEVRWGTNLGSGQSGLRFDGSQPPALGVNPGDIFQLGVLTHFNQPIGSGSAASAADLDVTLATTAGSSVFSFVFGIDETPNTPPCAYSPVVTPCPDAIFLPTSFSSATLTIGGTAYHLQILGFGPDASHIQSAFISQEGGNNPTDLWATLTQDPRDPNIPNVPEPTSMLLLASAAALAWKARKPRS